MAELNYATSCESFDSLMNSMTTSASSNLSFTSPGNFISPGHTSGMDNKQRGKYKKDALEHVDYVKEYLNDPKYKTELCKTWSESGFCAYGNKCRFAHGKQELFNKMVNCKKYKQKECTSFFKNNFCCYGSRCHFRHSEKKIPDLQRSYYSLHLKTMQTIPKNQIEEMSSADLLKVHQAIPCKVKRLRIFSEICNSAPLKRPANQQLPSFNFVSKSNKYLKSIENYNDRNSRFSINCYDPVALF